MTGPHHGHDPQTPPGAEAALAEFSDQLEAARLLLAEKRDAEVRAKDIWNKAKRRARFSKECPKAGTYDGVRVLKDDVDAWIDDQCADEELAKTARQAAKDHHETLRTQGSLAQTLSKSVADSYRGTGGHKW